MLGEETISSQTSLLPASFQSPAINKKNLSLKRENVIQHIRGWSISKSNKVVVKSFPGATTEDMEDFVKPLLRKKPDNVVLHTGTNDLNTQEPRLTAEGILST